jgi:cell division protein FtsW (lipid II flippase)
VFKNLGAFFIILSSLPLTILFNRNILTLKKNSMKKLFRKQTYIFIFLFTVLGLTRLVSFAQDSAASTSTTATNTSSSQTSFVMPMWGWVAIGIVVLIIIIALLSKNGNNSTRTDRVTVTKTTDTNA